MLRRRERGRDRVLTLVLAVLTLSSAGLCVAAASVEQVPEPALLATTRANCGPGSRPETGMQGRVPVEEIKSGRAAEGYTCNTALIGSYTKPNGGPTLSSSGGYKVERYVDASGHECAYYDTSMIVGLSLIDGNLGVNVLDMSDPAHPVRTASLITPAMLSPHESLVLNQERGLLVAVAGNPLFLPGVMDIYDVSQDCRHPVLMSTSPAAVLGHESGSAPDGMTFYAGSAGGNTLVAVDISNPRAPRTLWIGPYASHGLSISDDGNRAYVASVGGELIILDTTEIQARVRRPQVPVVSRLTWQSVSIPQSAIPVTIGGHPYVVEVDEFGTQGTVGAARIIDIADETKPRVISNLRLEVHQRENHAVTAVDPGVTNFIQGYAAHYCNVPDRTDPGIAACSMIQSGLRIFDIRDPYQPKEIAYFNPPLKPRPLLSDIAPNLLGNTYAMSSPSFVPERSEVWYSDGFGGFYALRLTNDVWVPRPVATAPAPAESEPEVASVAPEPSNQVAAAPSTERSRASLPRTGGDIPVALLLSAALSAVCLLVASRRARPRT